MCSGGLGWTSECADVKHEHGKMPFMQQRDIRWWSDGTYLDPYWTNSCASCVVFLFSCMATKDVAARGAKRRMFFSV